MELYSDKARVDKFSLLKKYIPVELRELSSAEEIMLKNLDTVIDRGIKIDVIRAKTEVMVRASTDMKDAARNVERNMWWKNKRFYLILIVLLIVVGVVIAWLVGAIKLLLHEGAKLKAFGKLSATTVVVLNLLRRSFLSVYESPLVLPLLT